ncbi:hypothetical protein RB595_006986 [Gaeumannomyces hyphopodioides]
MPKAKGIATQRVQKTRHRTRDLDQIQEDLLSPKHLAQWKDTKASEDLPGLGRHYCIECAKWFETDHSLVEHRKGKPHKRRLRRSLTARGKRRRPSVSGLRTTASGRRTKTWQCHKIFPSLLRPSHDCFYLGLVHNGRQELEKLHAQGAFRGRFWVM